MKELSWWFYYKHYSECFVQLKKCVAHRTDIRLQPSEIYTLTYVDSLLRENSYTASVFFGILTTAFVSFFVSLNIHSDVHRTQNVIKAIFGVGVMLNINKVMDTGSHFGILFVMPEAFKILNEGMAENSIIRNYNAKFFEEFDEELQKNKVNNIKE